MYCVIWERFFNHSSAISSRLVHQRTRKKDLSGIAARFVQVPIRVIILRHSSDPIYIPNTTESAEETLLDEGRPLDDSVIPALEAAIAEAKTVDIERPSMPMGLEARSARKNASIKRR